MRFLYAAPVLWNSLPDEFRAKFDIKKFKYFISLFMVNIASVYICADPGCFVKGVQL